VSVILLCTKITDSEVRKAEKHAWTVRFTFLRRNAIIAKWPRDEVFATHRLPLRSCPDSLHEARRSLRYSAITNTGSKVRREKLLSISAGSTKYDKSWRWRAYLELFKVLYRIFGVSADSKSSSSLIQQNTNSQPTCPRTLLMISFAELALRSITLM
jgi:hypothetical protein